MNLMCFKHFQYWFHTCCMLFKKDTYSLPLNTIQIMLSSLRNKSIMSVKETCGIGWSRWFNLLELIRVSQTSLDMWPPLQEWILLTIGHMNLKTFGTYDRNIFLKHFVTQALVQHHYNEKTGKFSELWS